MDTNTEVYDNAYDGIIDYEYLMYLQDENLHAYGNPTEKCECTETPEEVMYDESSEEVLLCE